MGKYTFGSDDSFYDRNENHTFYKQGNGRSGFINRAGNSSSTFGGEWARSDTTYASILSDGRTISKAGSVYYAGNKTYTVCGNTLTCSDGKFWSTVGGFTDREVRDIISNND